MNNFVWVAKGFFGISDASQVHFSSFKGLYLCGYYFREHLYIQISLKVWDSEEKLTFSSRLPLSLHIAQLVTFSILDPGKIYIYIYIYSPTEVGSTECSCHLVFQSSLHVSSLPATLQ